jgi:hypothetical protein
MKQTIHTKKPSSKSVDILKPYKTIIQKSLYQSFNNSLSLSTGKAAISAYKKAVNDADGLLELMVFYVECGNKFTVDYGDIDEQFYYSIETMFEKAVKIIKNDNQQTIDMYLPRLITIVRTADEVGWGYYDHMSEVLQ